MFKTATILFGLILSCIAQSQYTIPSLILTRLDQERYAEPNYNFAYDISDVNTGDIKAQSESRKGDTVFGQYSLIQPDGIKRIVDYKADDKNGFSATVNNEAIKNENIKAGSSNINNINRNVNNNRNNDNDNESLAKAGGNMEAEMLRKFLEEQFRMNPISQPTLTLSRSQIFQNIPDSPPQFIATILHRPI